MIDSRRAVCRKAAGALHPTSNLGSEARLLLGCSHASNGEGAAWLATSSSSQTRKSGEEAPHVDRRGF